MGNSGSTPAGASFGDIFNLCILRVYSGPRPATADAAETGTLLAEFTDAGGTYTESDGTNGLVWGDPTAGVVDKDGSQVWQATGLAEGYPVWARVYEYGTSKTGASTTVRRFDISCGSSGAELTLGLVKVGAPQLISSLPITLPMYA